MRLPSSFLWPESSLLYFCINLISRSPYCIWQDIVARKVQQQVYFNKTDQRLKLVLQFEGCLHASFLLCFCFLAHAWLLFCRLLLFMILCICTRTIACTASRVCVSVCAYGRTRTLKHKRVCLFETNCFLLFMPQMLCSWDTCSTQGPGSAIQNNGIVLFERFPVV